MGGGAGPHDLENTRLIFGPRRDAAAKAVTPDFYAEVAREFNGFAGRLRVSRHAFSEPRPHWERHADGDEMVCPLSGDMDFVLWIEDAKAVLRRLKPGASVVAPRGVRRCARPHAPSRMLFVTLGAGTEHGSPHIGGTLS